MFMHDRDDVIPSATEFGVRDRPAAMEHRWHRQRSPVDLALKRALDFAGSLALLILLSPALLFIALLIKLEDGGPVFFRQERHGLHGVIFRIFKFRTMGVSASSQGFVQCQPNDLRVTRIGRLLRRTSLDELPQFFNVLAGDMSLVGPRPHAVEHDYQACGSVEDYWQRYAVLPGMTGLAQIRGHRGTTTELRHMISRVQSDLEYVARGTVWLDLGILLSTSSVVLTGKNAH
jgi:putative colanic acid biosysnthesis UDP-glucose lipid carrier transferase